MRSDAQKKADKKYLNRVRNTTKAQLAITVDRLDFDYISNYCKSNNISKAQFIVNSCKYIIDNKISIEDITQKIEQEK